MGGQEGGRAHKGRAKASKENGSKPTSSLDNLMKLMASDFSGVVVEETHHQEAGTGADREAGAEQCGSQEGGVHVDSWLYSAVLAPPGAEWVLREHQQIARIGVLCLCWFPRTPAGRTRSSASGAWRMTQCPI